MYVGIWARRKGYLTFALYDYLTQTLHLKAQVTGELNIEKDLVDLCNTIAKKSNFDDLEFTQGTIMDFDVRQVQMY